MLIEHRTYTFRPGTLAPCLKKYEGESLPIQKQAGWQKLREQQWKSHKLQRQAMHGGARIRT